VLLEAAPERLADGGVVVHHDDDLVIFQELPEGERNMMVQSGYRLNHRSDHEDCSPRQAAGKDGGVLLRLYL
jgi:hypothetical protein